jgi:hypothetical protein
VVFPFGYATGGQHFLAVEGTRRLLYPLLGMIHDPVMRKPVQISAGRRWYPSGAGGLDGQKATNIRFPSRFALFADNVVIFPSNPTGWHGTKNRLGT